LVVPQATTSPQYSQFSSTLQLSGAAAVVPTALVS
jgi:hypothetical protein